MKTTDSEIVDPINETVCGVVNSILATVLVRLCLIMFSNTNERVKMTLICGPAKWTEAFLFEAAMHWATNGNRVVYVTPNRLESLPPKYHDGLKLHADIFQLVTFMYLPDYDKLAESLLTRLDMFPALPSLMIIDKLENYTRNTGDPEDDEYIAAKTCAAIIDAMNACSRILKKKVHVLATLEPSSSSSSSSSSSLSSKIVGNVCSAYFDDIWRFSIDDEGDDDPANPLITLHKLNRRTNDRSFKFRTLIDGTIVLKQVIRLVDE